MTPELILSASWEINSVFSIGINLGSAWVSDYWGTKDMPEGIYSWVLGIAITDKLGLFLETYGIFTKEENDDNRYDGGLTYLILPNLQLDVSGGFGLAEVSPDYFVSCGLSVLFAK